MTTNITDAHRAAFNALVSGSYGNFALFSCFVGGAPAAAIAAVNRDGDDFTITPLFVSVRRGLLDRFPVRLLRQLPRAARFGPVGINGAGRDQGRRCQHRQ